MQLGTVIGHATATLKHPSLTGLRLVIVQPLNLARQPEADPVLAVDRLGSHPGQTVVINSDGKGARDLVGDEKTPARWWISCLVDE
jgi:ethanolamine utilization protein EutN